MESMDNVRERFEALEQRTEPLRQHTHMVERRLRWWRGIACVLGLLGLVSLAPPSQAADFACAAGDVACLINAITQANANGEANTITLAAGTYTLTTVDNNTDGPNGLPSITGVVTIQGSRAETTILERDASAPAFRFVHVAAPGAFTLKRLTLRGGDASNFDGGCLFNTGGTVAIISSSISDNHADLGGGISNEQPRTDVAAGTITIAQSILTNNTARIGGGLFTRAIDSIVTITDSTISSNSGDEGVGGITNIFGTMIINNSTISDNRGGTFGGGGIVNSSDSSIIITNTTISNNKATAGGGGLANAATATLTNTTVADNHASEGGGIFTFPGTTGKVVMLNTILARNTANFGPDCTSGITSLGYNLFGNTVNCTIILQPTDLTGDPGLGNFTDNDTPGNGHFPLQRGSPAIDTGNDAICPPTDQLGRRRVNIRRVGTSICDIGAIEFRLRDDRQYDEEED